MREVTLEHLRAPGSAGTDRLRLHALRCEGDHIVEGILTAPDGRWWWIAEGVPRLIPASMYRNRELEARHGRRLRDLGLHTSSAGHKRGRLLGIQRRTIDRFGAEWLRFREWGFADAPVRGKELEWHGGLWQHTLGAFRSKTFLAGRVEEALCLDAGCGNGRFTAAALHEGAAQVLSVDIGWGVDATFDRFRDDPRVHVIQASLFDLPLAHADTAFSIGVLMHTGDPRRALTEIARVVDDDGLVALRIYHRGNWMYESVDRSIRAVSTRLAPGAQSGFAGAMARFGRGMDRLDRSAPRLKVRQRAYRVLRHWPTVHHNLDWWSAPVATHHTVPEVLGWCRPLGLESLRTDPEDARDRYAFFGWPESMTLLLQKNANAMSRDTIAA